eukprot:c23501_g1_i1 orf=228-1244(-)
MASIFRLPVIAEVSSGYRTDWYCDGASDLKVVSNWHPPSIHKDAITGHGCLDRALGCYTHKPVKLRMLRGGSSVTRAFPNSQDLDFYPDWFKSSVYRSSGGRKLIGTVTRCVYNSTPAGSAGFGGDPRVQQMLVEMVRIQVGKAHMVEFVDERSQHLKNIAEEAYLEYDKIAYRTMKGLDATGSQVLRQLDADANAIERDLKSARAELEAQSRDFEEFQIHIAYLKNEGLFFKNLYQAPRRLNYRTTLSKNRAKEKMAVVTSTSGEDFSSNYRRLLYGGLSLVIVSFIWSSSSAFFSGTYMRASKLASYGIIISLLLMQLAYIKVITGRVDSLDDSDY